MAKYIECEALRKFLIEHFDADFDSDGKLMYSDHICTGEDCEELLKLVDKIPTADVVEVRHGYLKDACEGFQCSCCRAYFDDYYYAFSIKPPIYCPICGAKMDGATK